MHNKTEEIVNLSRRAEALNGQGLLMAVAIYRLGISELSISAGARSMAG